MPTRQAAQTFPVAVMVARENVTDNRWISERWRVVGVVVGDMITAADDGPREIRRDEQGEHFLWPGFTVELFKDDCESYYFNLLAEKPSLFVVCHQDEENGAALEPFLATVSWDEAASYLEADTTVASVAMPPEIYGPVERFVLTHYVPEKRKKRKRVDWREQGP